MQLIVSDDHYSQISGNKLVKAVKTIYSLTIHRCIQLAFTTTAAPITGRVSSLVKEALQNNALLTYADLKIESYDTTATTELHAFAKKIAEIELPQQPISLLEILETRWIEFLYADVACNLEIVRSAILDKNYTQLFTFTKSSPIEKAAIQLSIEQKIPYKILSPIIAIILDPLQKIGRIWKSKQPYKLIAQDWGTFACGTHAQKTRTGTSKTKNKLLFVAYKDRTLRRVLAMSKQLVAQHGFEIYILGAHKGYSKAADQTAVAIREMGGKIFWASEFLTKKEVSAIQTTTLKTIKSNLPKLERKLPPVSYHGMDLSSEAHRMTRTAYKDGGVGAALYNEATKRALDFIDPNAIVHFEEWEINRCLSLHARAKGIPSVTFQTFSPSVYVGLFRRLSDYCFAPGEFMASAFQNIWTKDKITIIGDPLNDLAPQMNRSEEQNKFRTMHSIPAKTPLILLLTTYPDALITEEQLNVIYRKMIQAAEETSAQLVVKVHPQTPLQIIKQLFGNLGAKSAIFIHDTDLVTLATACDIAYMVHTSAAQSILMAKTPLIAVQPKSAQKHLELVYNFSNTAKIPLIAIEDDLLPISKELLQNGPRRDEQIQAGLKYVEIHAGPLDGKATERFAKKMKEILKIT